MGLRGTEFDRAAPGRYVRMSIQKVYANGTSVTGIFAGIWAHKQRGKLVDVIISQSAAGANGTNVTPDVQKNGSSMLTTKGILVVGAGAGAKTDVLTDLSLPANCTRPVIKTDGSQFVAKGDVITVDPTLTGTYSSTYPTVEVTAVFDTDTTL